VDQKRQQPGDRPIEQAGLEQNIRNVRTILDQTRESFGPDTRRQVEAFEGRINQSQALQEHDLTVRMNGEAWIYLAVVQLTEIVNGLLVQQAGILQQPQTDVGSRAGR
jgi:hypothetical protein